MLANMKAVFVFVSVLAVALAETGRSSNVEEDWAYQWFLDEAFLLTCNSSKLNVQSGEYITWMTPQKTYITVGQNDSIYELRNGSGVMGLELLIKQVNLDVGGVYTCYVHNDTMRRAKRILGINVHEAKYRKMFEKYRSNFIVAVIATAVFVVPLATSCFVYQFQYSDPETKARKARRRAGHQYTANGGDMPMKSHEPGTGGQENPGFNTQL